MCSNAPGCGQQWNHFLPPASHHLGSWQPHLTRLSAGTASAVPCWLAENDQAALNGECAFVPPIFPTAAMMFAQLAKRVPRLCWRNKSPGKNQRRHPALAISHHQRMNRPVTFTPCHVMLIWSLDRDLAAATDTGPIVHMAFDNQQETASTLRQRCAPGAGRGSLASCGNDYGMVERAGSVAELASHCAISSADPPIILRDTLSRATPLGGSMNLTRAGSHLVRNRAFTVLNPPGGAAHGRSAWSVGRIGGQRFQARAFSSSLGLRCRPRWEKPAILPRVPVQCV